MSEDLGRYTLCQIPGYFPPHPSISFVFSEFISHICRANTFSPLHFQWMISFFMEKIEIIGRAQPDKPHPDLLMYCFLFMLPVFTPVTKGKRPCSYLRPETPPVTWIPLLVISSNPLFLQFSPYFLYQRSADSFFCKRPESKYFRLCGP